MLQILLLVGLLLVVPAGSAAAQVGVQVGPGGVQVETGRDRDRRYRDRDYERRPQRCREVRTRTQMPDGSIRTVRERRCR